MKAPTTFRSRAREALADLTLRQALKKATHTALLKRHELLGSYDYFQRLRQQARAVRLGVIEALDDYLKAFKENALNNGADVHICRDSHSANDKVLEILRLRRAQRIVKAKSMVTEEIGLYQRLKQSGFSIVETDLGEYIVSLAGEKPSHITAPAIHKTKSQVGRLFHDALGAPYSDDPQQLAAIARKFLRKAFFEAQAGVTGANFALADTGGIVLFTNEGNGRMCSVLPPIHIAVMTPEKIIPSITDLDVFMRLLPASATGQSLTTYLSIISAEPRPRSVEANGEMHIVILDNTRSQIAKTEYKDILTCIRCGACMNVCPVYTSVGGHAYNSTYVGPMGIVLSSLLPGSAFTNYDITEACTLCRACDEVCPVAIPISNLIGRLRSERTRKGLNPLFESLGMRLLGTTFNFSPAYRFSQRLLGILLSAHKSDNQRKDLLQRLPHCASLPFHKRFQ